MTTIEVIDQTTLQASPASTARFVDRSEVVALIMTRLGERRLNRDPRPDPRLDADFDLYEALDAVIYRACEAVKERRSRLS